MRDRFGKKVEIATSRLRKISGEPLSPVIGPSVIKRQIKEASDEEVLRMIDLGPELMPSTHADMQVLNGRIKTPNVPEDQWRECVVKVRGRPGSFKSANEEREWRGSTEYVLNLPVNEEIAYVFDVFATPTKYYIIMEKAGGADLYEALYKTAGNGLTFEAAREVMKQLLAALKALHHAGAIHKDLKIENVMVDTAPADCASPAKVKVIDFDTVTAHGGSDSPKTKVRDVLGTDGYIAPEAYSGEYSPASDIFSTGVIMYKLMTGVFPYPLDMFDDAPGENWVGSPAMARIRRKLRAAKVDFDRPPFDNDRCAADLCEKMLCYKAADRITAEDALQHEWFEVELVSPQSPTSPKRRGGRKSKKDEF